MVPYDVLMSRSPNSNNARITLEVCHGLLDCKKHMCVKRNVSVKSITIFNNLYKQCSPASQSCTVLCPAMPKASLALPAFLLLQEGCCSMRLPCSSCLAATKREA